MPISKQSKNKIMIEKIEIKGETLIRDTLIEAVEKINELIDVENARKEKTIVVIGGGSNGGGYRRF